ncbi:MAG: hypothetical protein KDD60_10115 [Bdellovibrionales bacterium]|nr:hypothetical protein [Bdellovibrionales bacterium]
MTQPLPQEEFEKRANNIADNPNTATTATSIEAVFRATEILAERNQHADRRIVYDALKVETDSSPDRFSPGQSVRIASYFADMHRRSIQPESMDEAFEMLNSALADNNIDVTDLTGMERAEFLQARSQMHYRVQDYAKCIEDLQEAIDYAERHPGTITPKWEALHWESLASPLIEHGEDPSETLNGWESRIAELQAPAHDRSLSMLMLVKAQIAMSRNELESAMSFVTRGLQLAGDLPHAREYYTAPLISLEAAIEKRQQESA